MEANVFLFSLTRPLQRCTHTCFNCNLISNKVDTSPHSDLQHIVWVELRKKQPNLFQLFLRVKYIKGQAAIHQLCRPLLFYPQHLLSIDPAFQFTRLRAARCPRRHAEGCLGLRVVVLFYDQKITDVYGGVIKGTKVRNSPEEMAEIAAVQNKCVVQV